MKRFPWILGIFFLLGSVVVWAVPINLDGKNIHVTGGDFTGDNVAIISGFINIVGPGTGSISGYTIVISPNSISAPMLYSTSGTPGSTTFFRGDNTWAVPAASMADNSIVPAKMQVTSGFANSGTFYRGDGVWGSVIPADNSLSYLKLLDNTLRNTKILDNTIESIKLLDNTLLSSKIKFLVVPDNSVSVGTKGSWAMDNVYFYWCYSDNHWRRVSYDNTW